MKHGVLQRTRMSIGQDEPISIDPHGIRRRIRHYLTPQQVRHGSATHWSSGMAAVGGLRLIRRDSADRVDAEEFEVGGILTGHGVGESDVTRSTDRRGAVGEC